jgi:hypothetical protein
LRPHAGKHGVGKRDTNQRARGMCMSLSLNVKRFWRLGAHETKRLLLLATIVSLLVMTVSAFAGTPVRTGVNAKKPTADAGVPDLRPMPAIELKIRSSWGGQVNDVYVEPDDPNTAWVAAGRRLVALNVADPANVIELGSIELGTAVQAVAVRAGYAYVATFGHPNCFCVVDVSSPAAMRLVWSYGEMHAYTTTAVKLYGNAAYTVGSSDARELEVFDISDPEHPAYVRRIVGQPEYVFAIDIQGGLLYAAWYTCEAPQHPELRIFDIAADPFTPPLVGKVELGWPPASLYPISLSVEGEYASVVTDESAGNPFVIVNVADPTAPFVAGYNTSMLGTNRVVLSDGYAFAADWRDGPRPSSWAGALGLAIFDVAADPNNPPLVSTFKTHGTVRNVAVFGDRAYVMDDGEGLIILDVSAPANPVRLGNRSNTANWYSPANFRHLDKVGNLLYMSDEWNGFTILDVLDPRAPALAGVYQTPQTGYHMDHYGIEVRDGVAYLAAGFGQLQAVDVSVPSNPTLIGSATFKLGYELIGLKLSGNTAYAGYGPPSGSDFGLVGFDITNPEQMAVVGATQIGSPIHTITKPAANRAFLTREGSLGGGTLTVIDTTNPTPAIVSNISCAGIDVVRAGDRLYVANESSNDATGGLYVYSVDDPNVPLAHWGPARFCTAVAVQGQLAYVIATTKISGIRICRLVVLDVSETTPVFVAQIPIDGLGWITDILVDGPYIYLTGDDNSFGGTHGLLIVEAVRSGTGDRPELQRVR